jgi:hypothetical protein
VRSLRIRGKLARGAHLVFRHGASYLLPARAGGPARNGEPASRLFAAYHPSQQNTQTGRVTPAMYRRVLREIRRFLGR